MSTKRDVVTIHTHKCLRCFHLIDSNLVTDPEKLNLKKFSKCHFSKGNDLCPARSLHITRALDLQGAALAYKEAEEDGKTKEISKILHKLNKYHPVIRAKVLALAKKL